MATLPYTDSNSTYGETHGRSDYGRDSTDAPRSMRREIGAQIFIWLAWAAAAAFWGMTLTTGMGIVSAVQSAPGGLMGGADAGGVGWLLIDVIGGIVVLGLAMAFGAWRYATRDKRMDPVTERATANLYDSIAAQGGEDLTTRSPEARSPLERDAYRASQSDLR